MPTRLWLVMREGAKGCAGQTSYAPVYPRTGSVDRAKCARIADGHVMNEISGCGGRDIKGTICLSAQQDYGDLGS